MTYRPNHTILRHYRNKVATADIVCPKCGSDSIWRDGFKVTRRGRQQRFQCVLCGFKFC